jgi:hypothetical protein
MDWTKLLHHEIENEYRAAEGLFGLVSDDSLKWKPPTGTNWMTVGQLLRHVTEACGMCCKGFVTGEWPMPENPDPEATLPPATKMASVETVAQAREMLAADKAVALAMVEQAGEQRLASEPAPAPWDPTPIVLGHRLAQMVGHLATHKAQLFYYIKLQGKPVNTMHLYGMSA